jgi:hypothetical protein
LPNWGGWGGYDGWKLENCINGTGGNSNAVAIADGRAGFLFLTKGASEPQYLISPQIAKTTEGTKLSFYYKNINTGYTESFMVGYSSTTDDIDAFTFDETLSTKENKWIHYDKEIPVGTKYVCIKCTSIDKHYLAMDHFEGNKDEIILLSSGSKLGYSKNPRTLHAFRCHFKTYSDTKARSFEMDFGDGEATGVIEISGVNEVKDNSWYTLDGRKLNGKPTKKGLYIHNGLKVFY